MPWKAGDVKRFSKKAASSAKRRAQWVAVANTVLGKTGNESSAIRQANAAATRKRKS